MADFGLRTQAGDEFRRFLESQGLLAAGVIAEVEAEARENACWEWQGRRDKDGYGRLGRSRLAHRVAYEALVGPIPEGMHVLHRCDNPPCVRPDHLWLGTNADNMADRDAKGRLVQSGSKNNNARLTEEQVRSIRVEVEQGVSQASIARRLGVSVSTVNLAVKGKSWHHVEAEAAGRQAADEGLTVERLAELLYVHVPPAARFTPEWPPNWSLKAAEAMLPFLAAHAEQPSEPGGDR